jgi:hypothetical protein
MDDQNNQPGILNAADDAVIADPVSPEADLVAGEGFAKTTGVLLTLDALPKVLENLPLDGFIQPPHILQGLSLKLNAPGQASSPPLPG